MHIVARIANRQGEHRITLATNDVAHSLELAPKANGLGSRANGGELLCLALGTCYCNDLYREAAQRGMTVHGVEVEVEAEFGAPGEAARSLRYRAAVHARASEEEIRTLMLHTDCVAEIQNTLRKSIDVRFEVGSISAVP